MCGPHAAQDRCLPVFAIAVEEIQERNRANFNVTLSFITSKTALSYTDDMPEMLAKKYYREIPSDSLTLLINPGLYGDDNIAPLTASWDMLHINT